MNLIMSACLNITSTIGVVKDASSSEISISIQSWSTEEKNRGWSCKLVGIYGQDASFMSHKVLHSNNHVMCLYISLSLLDIEVVLK